MSQLPWVIPSCFINFASPNNDPNITCHRHLRVGQITLTRHTLSPNSGVYIGAQQVIVARHCGMPLQMDWRLPDSDTLFSKLMIRGTIHLKSAGEQFWQRWLFPADVLVIAFEKVLFEKLAMDAAGSPSSFVSELGVTDTVLSELTSLLDRELREGCLNGRFYVENLGAALAAYLVRRRKGKSISTTYREVRLAPVRLRRVVEYIDAHLDCDLGLEEIATVAGLNTHHFAHAFKATTGIPPHRFIVDRRIQAARSYLQTTRDPIANIALSCGFASQSHFTEVFRRMVGLTPAQYRRQL